MSLSRRGFLRLSPPAMATTFLPGGSLWIHAADHPLMTRQLGRTGREVTTFGLAGGNKVMWDLPGQVGVEIAVKAIRAGVTYLESANNYQLSQRNYNRAFRILNLIPGQPGYDRSLRARLFIASKTQLRYALIRDGSPQRGTSRWGGKTAVEDLLNSLSVFFGDGKGYIPDGAYLDLMQIHSLRADADVDAVFEGNDNPSDTSAPRIGALAALRDFRDGANYTGLNPKLKKYIRHIGITGHENPAAHMYAMRKDARGDLETLLVAVNPNDRQMFCHQTNSVPVAAAKNMGIIGMKVFADGVMYGLPKAYASRPGQSVPTVGQPGKVRPGEFIEYTLSTPGMSTLITGIGVIDRSNDPARDQLLANLAACQMREPPGAGRRAEIEVRTAQLHGTDTNFFQRPSDGLQPPQNFTLAQPVPGGPARLSWMTAYAAGDPIVRYEIYRRDERLASIAYQPQLSERPFAWEDVTPPASSPGGTWYRIRAVDASGRTADTLSLRL